MVEDNRDEKNIVARILGGLLVETGGSSRGPGSVVIVRDGRELARGRTFRQALRAAMGGPQDAKPGSVR